MSLHRRRGLGVDEAGEEALGAAQPVLSHAYLPFSRPNKAVPTRTWVAPIITALS